MHNNADIFGQHRISLIRERESSIVYPTKKKAGRPKNNLLWDVKDIDQLHYFIEPICILSSVGNQLLFHNRSSVTFNWQVLGLQIISYHIISFMYVILFAEQIKKTIHF